MAIRFTCLACKTILKIGERISETKKVRCTGCSVVIVLTPDEDAPDGMIASIPNQAPKPKSEPGMDAKLWVLLGVAGAALVILVIGLWWASSGDRAAIEGDVTLNALPMDGGTIDFELVDDTKKFFVSAQITRNGRYSLSAAEGPAIGKNKVMIRGSESQKVADRYNILSDKYIDIGPGANEKNFAVTSK